MQRREKTSPHPGPMPSTYFREYVGTQGQYAIFSILSVVLKNPLFSGVCLPLRGRTCVFAPARAFRIPRSPSPARFRTNHAMHRTPSRTTDMCWTWMNLEPQTKQPETNGCSNMAIEIHYIGHGWDWGVPSISFWLGLGFQEGPNRWASKLRTLHRPSPRARRSRTCPAGGSDLSRPFGWLVVQNRGHKKAPNYR